MADEMGNLLSNPATDAGTLDANDDNGPRSAVSLTLLLGRGAL